jgi:type 1 glutamine amidotransferase
MALPMGVSRGTLGALTMKTRIIVCLGLFALGAFLEAAPLRVHIISGAKEYRSEASMKGFSQWMAKRYDVKFTASWGHDGIEKLAGLDALKDADVMFVFARRMKLKEEQMKLIRAHWEAGKPVVGVRTASHAFQKADNEIFDRKVMGGNYLGHFSNEPLRVINVAKAHPVLRGVRPFGSSKLYKAGPLAKSATVLQRGDIGTDKQDVTWVNTWKGGRTFYTSLGVPEDFENENFKRLLVNAIFWTAKRDLLRR